MQYITLVGDIHGKFQKLYKILDVTKNRMIALGDIGIGFGDDPLFPNHFQFIHGNHDNPDLCKYYSGFLGRYGYDSVTEIFHVSGAESVDKDHRIPGATWWYNEQLNIQEMDDCLELYRKTKPKIVLSHDAPFFLYPELLHAGGHSGKSKRNLTNTLLETMFESHQPKEWYFGHFHVSYGITYQECMFQCLGELETKTIQVFS